MRTTSTLFISSILISLYCSKSPHVFGNGCLAADNQLIMAAFVQLTTEKEQNAYYIDVGPNLNVTDSYQADWKPYTKEFMFPGKLVMPPKTPEPSLYYVINSVTPTDFLKNNHPVHHYSGSSISSKQSFNNSHVSFSQQEAEYFELYREFLPKDIRIAVDYNKQRYFLDSISHPVPYGSALRYVTVQTQNGKLRVIETKGDFPNSKKGFSATLHENRLFVTGGDFDGDYKEAEMVYILDLETLTWSKIAVPSFYGARSGCLAYLNGYLVHAFGLMGGSYLSSTQFIDTRTWTKVQDSSDTEEVHSTTTNSSTIPLVIGILGGASLVLVIVLVVFLFKRRRNQEKSMQPPEFITNKVWVDPRLSCGKVDTRFSSLSRAMYFDNGLELPQNSFKGYQTLYESFDSTNTYRNT